MQLHKVIHVAWYAAVKPYAILKIEERQTSTKDTYTAIICRDHRVDATTQLVLSLLLWFFVCL